MRKRRRRRKRLNSRALTDRQFLLHPLRNKPLQQTNKGLLASSNSSSSSSEQQKEGSTVGLEAWTVGSDARDVDTGRDGGLEGTRSDEDVIICDVHLVLPCLCGPVPHVTRAISLVKALNLCLARTLDREAKSSRACLPRVDCEVARVVSLARRQAWSVSFDLKGVSFLWGVFFVGRGFERGAWHLVPLIQHLGGGGGRGGNLLGGGWIVGGGEGGLLGLFLKFDGMKRSWVVDG